MKPLFSLVFIIIMASLTMLSCRKAALVEGHSSPGPEVRGGRQTEKNDTVNVTTDITPEGWAGSTDVDFDFG